MEKLIDSNKFPYTAAYEKRVDNVGLGAKRINEIKAYLDDFIEVYKDVKNIQLGFIENLDSFEIAKLIAEKYFQIYFQFRKFVNAEDEKKLINIYKVISGLELAVCDLRPFAAETQELRSTYNADFAFYLSLAYLYGYFNTSFESYNFKDSRENEHITDLIKEHINWLKSLQGQYHLPYFPNSHMWWALRLLLDEMSKTNG